MNYDENKFNKDFAEDFKTYPHRSVENAYVLIDKPKKKYERAHIEICGRSCEFIVYDSFGNRHLNIKAHTSQGRPTFFIEKKKDGFVYLLLFDEEVMLLQDDCVRCYNYIVGEVMRDEYKEIACSVNDGARLFISSGGKEMVINYIARIAPKFFTNPKYIEQIDAYLIFFNTAAEAITQTNMCHQLNSVTREAIKQLDGNFKYSITTDNDVPVYFSEYFYKFSAVIQKRFNLTELVAQLVTYKSIQLVCVEFFSEKFIESTRFRQDFVWDNLTKEELIEAYLNIDCIEHNNQYNFASYVFFLMNTSERYRRKTFYDNYNTLRAVFSEALSSRELQDFQTMLETPSDSLGNLLHTSIDDVDLMTGIEFENLIANLFERMGFVTKNTKASGDQGVDIIAKKNGITIAVQAKCYSSKVSNAAVQEVVAGKRFYRADKAMVITNNYFTSSAVSLAESNNVVLWDRDMLESKLNKFF